MLILPKPRLSELDDGRNALAFEKEIGRIQTPLGEFQASSDAIIFAEVLKTMFRDSKKVLIISVLSVFLFVFLDFRSLRKSLMVMFSILAGVFWVFGVMYLSGTKLNLYNMVMIPAVMGMSIDNSIHVFHRYEELGRGSLSKVLSTTGISAMLASFTNAAGFFGLVFCTHGGLKSMGIVASIGLGTCLITTLLYLPMILQFLEERKNPEGDLFRAHLSCCRCDAGASTCMRTAAVAIFSWRGSCDQVFTRPRCVTRATPAR